MGQENLKILKQYTRLLAQACHATPASPPAAHTQPLSQTPQAYPPNLQWFEHLAKPCRGLDDAGSERITTLLQLHAACDKKKSAPVNTRDQAYELAASLPHFDRDLTAYYLSDAAPAHEYELHVAHSILRLHAPATRADLLTQLKTWRTSGLLHVLAVAAHNMPELADWYPIVDPNKDESACSLCYCLDSFNRRPRDHASTIQRFIDSQDQASPTSQAIATTLDRLAILMGVRSNAPTPPKHDLASALQAFPSHVEDLEPHAIWTALKPAIEQALPPSLLRLDPACARKRVKQAQGTW